VSTVALDAGRDPLSLVFAALADPTRRAILARLKGGPRTVGELGEPFDMTGPAVSKHLRVLERAGLVSRSRIAQARPATLEAAPLEQVAEWAEEFRQFWDERFDRLDDYLATMTDEEDSWGCPGPTPSRWRPPTTPTTPRSSYDGSSVPLSRACGGR
jgi:DNA-binding transcriptional ArsR family regulator